MKDPFPDRRKIRFRLEKHVGGTVDVGRMGGASRGRAAAWGPSEN